MGGSVEKRVCSLHVLNALRVGGYRQTDRQTDTWIADVEKLLDLPSE